MSGAIIVEGIDQYYPQVRNMRERVLILRDHDLEHGSASVQEEILRRVEVTCSACGAANEQKQERIFTLNGEIRPRIPIDSVERQFWRIVNASPDLYADLQVSGGQFEIVALDGMPLSYHDPHRSTQRVDHVLVLAYAENGTPSDSPEWLDTVNVPYGGTVDLIMDFTDPIIRGMSVFHVIC